ncbi:hypothetical protein PTSG_05571 [Salpingoeca rosetta]|uniref:PDZ domain-containing protein n=1 Tax=Salpingoeca rosetta (strain ATCC 50818 / BSB-021) TaxID=946362 RepID=F2UBL0_SALR5|nr:uncharacterized protein PTSG_05571 [Salpingoeca rosetta]EGD73876.1 hypothetical protein PTSG_05571 [Salpingoeca rosetta]|eukprot:XP_004993439.1 hypothetical protein PTSG_05571 [Salpingoeca rosetta]
MTERVTLQRNNGFGFSITGGHPADVVVSKIKPGSPAASCGVLSVGDRLISLNGQPVTGLSQIKVVDMVRRAGQTLEVEFKRVAGTRTDLSATPSTPERTRRTRTAAGSGGVSPKPAVAAKPSLAPKPTLAPKPAPKPAAKPAASTDIPAGVQAQLSAVLDRVTASAAKLGIAVAVDSAAKFETRLQETVEQLETALDGDGLVMGGSLPVVDRIERASAQVPIQPPPSAPKPRQVLCGDVHARLAAVVSRLESATDALTGPPPAQQDASGGLQFGRTTLSASGQAEDDFPSVVAYDVLLQTRLRVFLEASDAIGEEVEEQAELVKHAFIAQRRLLSVVPAASKPGPKVLPQLMEATQDAVAGVTRFKEACRGSRLINHLSTVAEGIVSLGWVAVEPKPAPFVRDMADAAQFYANRVIKEYKDTMTFWSNAIAQTAPGDGDADKYIFNSKLGVPTTA